MFVYHKWKKAVLQLTFVTIPLCVIEVGTSSIRLPLQHGEKYANLTMIDG